MEMLGIQVDRFSAAPCPSDVPGWDESERRTLRATIAARQPFLDFWFSRINGNGTRQSYRVGGEPMFSQSCRFLGYRGIGIEVTPEAWRRGPVVCTPSEPSPGGAAHGRLCADRGPPRTRATAPG